VSKQCNSERVNSNVTFSYKLLAVLISFPFFIKLVFWGSVTFLLLLVYELKLDHAIGVCLSQWKLIFKPREVLVVNLHWGRFLSEYFGIPLSVIILLLLHPYLS